MTEEWKLIAAGLDADADTGSALAGLAALRTLRERLDRLEPELIAGARHGGASWAEVATALGVASRQAAERRYLRLRHSGQDAAGGTRDDRVLAERDRRAGDRAVTAWARDHGADLRQLAGQITALTDLGPAAQASLDRLHHGLSAPDAADLLPLLAETRRHLPAQGALAERVGAVDRDASEVRRATQAERTRQRTP